MRTTAKTAVVGGVQFLDSPGRVAQPAPDSKPLREKCADWA